MPKTVDELILKLERAKADYRREALEHDLKAAKAWSAVSATHDALELAKELRDVTKETDEETGI